MSQYVRMLSALQERMKSHAVLSSFRDALEPVIDDAQTAPFTRMRRIVDAISEIDKRAAIMLKITRTLEREMPLAMEADR